MLKPLRQAAVRVVKPRVSAETWAKLRDIDPLRRKRCGQLVVRPRNPATRRAASRQYLEVAARRRSSLESMATKYRNDDWVMHGYAPRYERHFTKLRDTAFTMLEIGIGSDHRGGAGGSSLRMWKHFFPKAQIVGLDLCDRSFLNEKRVLTYQGNQTDADLLRLIARRHHQLKIIIDDGGHRPEQIRT